MSVEVVRDSSWPEGTDSSDYIKSLGQEMPQKSL